MLSLITRTTFRTMRTSAVYVNVVPPMPPTAAGTKAKDGIKFVQSANAAKAGSNAGKIQSTKTPMRTPQSEPMQFDNRIACFD